jgi:hypothetical protein
MVGKNPSVALCCKADLNSDGVAPLIDFAFIMRELEME